MKRLKEVVIDYYVRVDINSCVMKWWIRSMASLLLLINLSKVVLSLWLIESIWKGKIIMLISIYH